MMKKLKLVWVEEEILESLFREILKSSSIINQRIFSGNAFRSGQLFKWSIPKDWLINGL